MLYMNESIMFPLQMCNVLLGLRVVDVVKPRVVFVKPIVGKDILMIFIIPRPISKSEM